MGDPVRPPGADSQPTRYATEINNATHLGLTLSFTDETEITGPEDDGSPTYFAQLDHPREPCIYQGPARDLATFLQGYQWALRIYPAHLVQKEN